MQTKNKMVVFNFSIVQFMISYANGYANRVTSHYTPCRRPGFLSPALSAALIYQDTTAGISGQNLDP
jgi:hypothetical protein